MRARIVIVLMGLCAGCDDRPDHWDAMIYPDAESDQG